MALTNAMLKATLAAPLIAVAFTASAAGKLPVIEISTTDLSKPVAAACVKTTPGQPGLTAWGKLKTIMSARGQMIAVSGDKISKGNKYLEMMFTVSNDFSGKEGYIIDSPLPKGQKENADGFCFEPVKNAVVIDNKKLSAVPAVINKGELGIALANNHGLGSKVAVMGMKPNGSLFAVHFNPDSPKLRGAYKEADAQGGKAGDLGIFDNFDYSPKMKAVMERLNNSGTEVKPN